MSATMPNEAQSNVFRPTYRELTSDESEAINAIKDNAAKLYAIYMGREIALAKTKLEESVMWAVKGITK